MRVVVYVFSPLRGEYVVYRTAKTLDEAVDALLEALREHKTAVAEVVEQ